MTVSDLVAPDLVAHEEAHVKVAGLLGWNILGIEYSARGASGMARYEAPSYHLGRWQEMYVTLAGVVSGCTYSDDLELAMKIEVKSIARKARRYSRGFRPKKENDAWKVARLLVGMSCADYEDKLDAAFADVLDLLVAT